MSAPSVLVVDDDPAIRLLCRLNLELDGYAVREAASLEEARAALREAAAAVVLLDVHLGGTDATEFLTELRREGEGARIALLTGSADERRLSAAGADAVLGKPFTLEELRATVGRLCRAAR